MPAMILIMVLFDEFGRKLPDMAMMLMFFMFVMAKVMATRNFSNSDLQFSKNI